MTSALPARTREVGIAGTTIAHGALIVLALLTAHRGTTAQHLVYEVNLVAAPRPLAGARNATAAPVPRPAAPPVKPRTAKPTPRKAPVPARRSAPAQMVTAPVVPAPGEKPGTGTDVVTLHQAGVQFPFPEYLKHIENMVLKRWNHSIFRPGLEARIAFVISKDGSVATASYLVEKSSGNAVFDEYARSAIESVVANHEFGPLPDGFNGVSLPILFVFTQVPRGTP